MKRRKFMATALTAGIASAATPAGTTGMTLSGSGAAGHQSGKKPRLMFYHDSRHPAIYMFEPPMQKEEFEAAVDELVGTDIDALMFNLADGRTMFHDTKAGEVWGHWVKEWPHMIFRRAHRNAKMMMDSGKDPLRIVCERAQAKGLPIYIALLVNQGRRGTREQDPRSSNFRWENVHLEIGAKGDLKDFPGSTNLDFKHNEVRSERFAIIEEVLQNYPVDGFELQLNYKSPDAVAFFHPQEIAAGREIMTAWVKQVYNAVKASGQGRELAIRVPASVETCYALGLDVQEWIQQGIVDVLIGETYQHEVDQLTDFGPLVKAAKGSNCRVHGAIGIGVRSDRLSRATIEIIRAAACNCWSQGVDGIYLAQWFGEWPYPATFYEKLREVAHPDLMAPKDKFYFLPTTGVFKPKPSEPKKPLPRKLKVNHPEKVKLLVSDDLPRWHKMGRVHEVILRFRIAGCTELDRLKFQLNGNELSDDYLRKIDRTYRMRAPRQRVYGYWFIYRLPEHLWPKVGENIVKVTLLKRTPHVIPPISLRDLELETKYLGGKNLPRGQDPDTGPYVVQTV